MTEIRATRPHRARTGRRVIAAVSVLAAASAFVIAGSSNAAGGRAYDDNLALIRGASVRNTNHDASADRATAQRDLVIADHIGPRSEYLGNPGGNPETAFPVLEGGQFRAGCEFSHFAYDDPLVKPGQPGASHLHMFWGNTDTNAFSTLDTLTNSGSSTCNGGELNRTGYWAPAMFDGDGSVRIPERITVYYKGYGLANGRSQTYPPGAAIVTDENVHEVPWDRGGTFGPDTGDWTYNCSDQFRGLRTPAANTIPTCDGSRFFNEYGVADDPHATLEMHVKFPNCWNGQDPSVSSNWGLARIGGWFYSECEERATFPNLEYIIAYPLELGETTEDWFLSSDVDPTTLELMHEGGTMAHADWWGGWHPSINQQWIDNCVNFRTDQPSDCGFGYLTDGGPDGNNPIAGPALALRPQYEGVMKVDANSLFGDLCRTSRVPQRPTEAAYCTPSGPMTMPTTIVTPATTAAPTTVAPASTVPASTVPASTVVVDPLLCEGRAATIVGTAGDDVLTGTLDADVIVALDGNDLIDAATGTDVVCGGPGDDLVIGDGGDDSLFGGDGDDMVAGGSGKDRIIGGAGDDTIHDSRSVNDVSGGDGNDRCNVSRNTTVVSCETMSRVTSTRSAPV